MLRHASLFAGMLALAATAHAQCSTLSITGTGAPGTSLTVSIDGTAAGAIAFLVVGETQGTTPVDLGQLGSFTLGLAAPFVPLPIGMTNAAGDASLSIPVPASFPGSLDLFAQGLTLAFSMGSGTPPTFSFAWCASNVGTLHAGS